MGVAVRGLTKAYRARRRPASPALTGVDLDVPTGELMVVLGPSGSGKTTLLRCIAGLEQPDSGSVVIDDRDVTSLPPGERDVAMVFQELALYPHLSARDNVAFGLRARRTSADEITRRVDGAASMLGLEGLLDRQPSELAGGERQRVALARAVVREPHVFLLDEPLSGLDSSLRAHARAEVKSLQRRLGTAMLYVTHDQVEAMTLGDRIAILRAGAVEQVGPPGAVYREPASPFVATFIGNPPMNVVPRAVLGLRGEGFAGIRPEDVSILPRGPGRIEGVTTAAEDLGAERIVYVDVSGHVIRIRHNESAPPPGTQVELAFADADVHTWDGA